MTSLDSAIFNSEFKTCVFSKDLIIILENINDINLNELKLFLDNIEPTFFQFGNCIKIFFDKNEIILRGYKLKNAWIASEMSDNVYTIPFCGNKHELITTLYYFYHMSTCI